jgi:hypothetical protein
MYGIDEAEPPAYEAPSKYKAEKTGCQCDKNLQHSEFR